MSTPPPVPADQAARDAALDITRSVIVQAPAGSGKTGLLTQRFLRLLSHVEQPEEIVAITFTRKAAGEMRDRLLEALAMARDSAAPDEPHERVTWALARAALQHDQRQGWQLLANPGRLNLQTIDSLCADLARQMPLLSQFGAVPQVTEDASPLYREAARLALLGIDGDSPFADDIGCLLAHRDNNMNELQQLIVTMLGRRDQWSSLVVDPEHPTVQREQVEGVLANLVGEALAEVVARVPVGQAGEIAALARFAAGHLDDPVAAAALGGLQRLPGDAPGDLAAWQQVARFLLTGDDWRKPRGITVKQGFPPAGRGGSAAEQQLFGDMKERMQRLLEALAGEDEFRRALGGVSGLPNPCYSDAEWQVLRALFGLLKLALAQLRVVFSRSGEVDFIEIALQATQALGDDDEPTDLALRLDHQVRHLLVDEFQDTSRSQYRLLRRLTANWTAGEPRTLFLVGDPMQSIYRFREADVGLFISAWATRRLGHIALDAQRLTVNFRSQGGIVEWVNQSFARVLPASDDTARGAVSYVPSHAHRAAEAGDAVQVHPFVGRDDAAEAQAVLRLVDEARRADPAGTTAILARGKAHLLAIVEALKTGGFEDFTAVEIDPLATRPVVQDLLSLTRALLHPADRVAWLAVLRAPCCGLALADLLALAGAHAEDRHATIPARLADPARRPSLTADGRKRVERVWPLLAAARDAYGRLPPRDWIEGTWIALGGPATVTGQAALEDAEAYFQVLEEYSLSGRTLTAEDLVARVQRLFALPYAGADHRLQIMTMHKAKGLEFDTVILPGLGRRPRGDDRRLLYWLEQTAQDGGQELVFGALPGSWDDSSPVADYIRRLENDKTLLENGRLLYVAATRARRRLHLLGHVERNRDGSPKVENASLLAPLWPVVADAFATAQAALEPPADEDGQGPADGVAGEGGGTRATVLRRLPAGWSCPPPGEAVVAGRADEPVAGDRIDFDWAGEQARMVGVVAHRLLQQIAERGLQPDERPAAGRYADTARYLLRREGVPPGSLEEALQRVVAALENTLADARGRWILSAEHREARCELPLTVWDGDTARQLVIDRTFVDHDGVRWIIDYKTGSHEGGGREAFLQRERARYEAQLGRYAAAFAGLEDRPIRVALYYPAFAGWISW